MAEPPPSPAPTLFRDSFQSPADLPSGYNSSNDDHFSDAQEGRESEMSDSDTTPSPTMPIPPTDMSKLDEALGTEPFEDLSDDDTRVPDGAETPKKRRSMSITIPGAFGGSDCDADDDNNVESTPETPRSGVPVTVLERTDNTSSDGKVTVTETLKERLADLQPDVDRSPSPIPTMIVQRIEEDKPYHGEVPGTEAYEKRAADAQPDIIVRWNEEEDRITRRVQTQREKIEKMVQDGGTPVVAPLHGRARSVSPSVNKVDEALSNPVYTRARSASPSFGNMDSMGKREGAMAGDESTVVVSGGFLEMPVSKASLTVDLDAAENDIPNTSALSPTFSTGFEEHTALRRRKSSAASRKSRKSVPPSPATPSADFGDFRENEEADDDFGDDDFDDFGEVVEGEEFDDFEGFGETTADFKPVPIETPQPTPQPPAPVKPVISVPVLDHKELGGAEAIIKALSESLEIMFPTGKKTKLAAVEDSCFLTERSLSLWNQLVAPPPLQPPNWKISRIRRLFLVSLGVPVDLDEILPAETKQKKLVLPSINTLRRSSGDDGHRSRSSSQSRSSRPSSRARKAAADDKNKNGGIGPESLDVPSARILCSTSDVALSGLTVEELQEHVKELEKVTQIAGEVLTYWLRKRESAIGDKETFETVIESLVGYARKKRQNG
ncbi:uncharacterized protein H6S33_009513 [Morchella sextelata]|uniref:uncharacterized protein n=1 Tax=Morchella sextelata TaxID=1174677 RepID=UPI001D0442BB|nr:uncharacterized protein H6S33_009513 [Morchella sextelata]KAH0613133.1 hypothetical protein H6S33_009513 [Morchella sextelata]